jgi:hypothetical protein
LRRCLRFCGKNLAFHPARATHARTRYTTGPPKSEQCKIKSLAKALIRVRVNLTILNPLNKVHGALNTMRANKHCRLTKWDTTGR